MLLANFYFSSSTEKVGLPRHLPSASFLVRWWLGLWVPICQQLASSGPASAFRLPLNLISTFLDVITELYKSYPSMQRGGGGGGQPLETDVWGAFLSLSQLTEERRLSWRVGRVLIINMSAVMDRFRTNWLWCGGAGRQSLTQLVPALQVIDRSPGWVRVRAPGPHIGATSSPGRPTGHHLIQKDQQWGSQPSRSSGTHQDGCAQLDPSRSRWPH